MTYRVIGDVVPWVMAPGDRCAAHHRPGRLACFRRRAARRPERFLARTQRRFAKAREWRAHSSKTPKKRAERPQAGTNTRDESHDITNIVDMYGK